MSGAGGRPETAVVTGAGRGIGLEIARRLAARGYAVLVTDVDQQAAERSAAELGAPAWALGLDVRDPEGHRVAAAAAAERGTPPCLGEQRRRAPHPESLGAPGRRRATDG